MKDRGRGGESESFSTSAFGRSRLLVAAPQQHRILQELERSRCTHLPLILTTRAPQPAPGFWLPPSDWMPKEEWAHCRNCSKVLRRHPSTRWDAKAKSRDQCYGRKIRRLVFFVCLVGFFFPDCYLQVGFLGASLLKQIIHRDQRAGDYAFESECIFLVYRNSHAAELS